MDEISQRKCVVLWAEIPRKSQASSACYASSRILPPPPKEEAPKPPTPVPDVPKPIVVQKSAEEQPAQKKAALTSEPKPVPVASSAAVFLEPASKAPPAKAAKAGPATPSKGSPTSKSAAKSKSLATKSRPKRDDQAQMKEPVKIEASECNLKMLRQDFERAT